MGGIPIAREMHARIILDCVIMWEAHRSALYFTTCSVKTVCWYVQTHTDSTVCGQPDSVTYSRKHHQPDIHPAGHS